jgi:hypothetical protein
MRSLRPMIVLCSLLIVTLACGDTGTAAPPAEDALETVVAATLSAGRADEAESGEKQPPVDSQSQPPPGDESQPAERPQPEAVAANVPCITYTDGGNVWLLEGTKPPAQLTGSGDASKVMISTDCQKVAFVRSVGPDQLPEVRSVNTDGSGEMTLLTSAQIDALYPLDPNFSHNAIANIDFIPNSHELIFNTRAVPAEGPGLFKYNDLVRLDSDSGSLTAVFPAGSGGDFALSPDGTQLALVLPDTIGLVNIDGSNLRANLISYTPVITYSEFQYYAQPIWTLVSDAIGVAIPSSDPLAAGVSGTIWRVPEATAAATNVATISGDFYFTQAFSEPSLSPNLQRVAFLRETGTPNIKDLCLANADGSGEVIYDTGNIQWQGWALDSTHFAYSLGGPMNLHLGVDGGSSTPIGSCNNLRWRDNNTFVCLSGSMGSWSLMRGQIGGSLTALVSPAGDFIAYDFNR